MDAFDPLSAVIVEGPPFGRRFVVALSCVVIGYAVIFWHKFDVQRRIFRAARDWAGGVLVCAGLLLWFLTLFPATWDWWI